MEQSNISTWELHGEIGVLRLNNPPQNYLEKPEFVALDTFSGWLGRDRVKGLLITSAGRHFSAGANIETLKELARDPAELAIQISKGKALLEFIRHLDIPVIASIRGVCFGGGLEIALAAHIRVCSENAIFSLPEVNRQLIPGLGGIPYISSLAGFEKAVEIALSGDTINARQAHQAGLVSYVVPAPETEAFSLQLMNKMVSGRNLAVIRAVMQALKNSRTLPFDQAMQEETRMFCELVRISTEM